MLKASYKINEEKNGVEITFTAKPSEEVRTALKSAGYRWGRGYWYAKQTPERLALAQTIAAETTEAPKATKTATKGTPQNRVKFYYNGLRLNGEKSLLPCYFYRSGKAGAVTISAKNYKDLPRDLFEVVNDSDIYTDYFDDDHATLEPSHPLYKFALYACAKAEAMSAKKHIEWLKKRNPERYAAEIARSEETIKEFEAMTDPGQPTAEDLAQIDRQRQEEENARIEAEHARALAEREKVLAARHNGMEYIESVSAQYPIKDGEPVVEIPFSENPAFYNYMVEDRKTITRHPDGTTTEEITEKMPRCILSLTAADIVLKHFDQKRHNENTEEGKGGYDKTDFVITWTDENGEECKYEGRYDLGDNDGGLVEHIKALGEWERTHDRYNHEKPTPDETNERLQVAEFFGGVIADTLHGDRTEETREALPDFVWTWADEANAIIHGERSPFTVETLTAPAEMMTAADLVNLARQDLAEIAKAYTRDGEPLPFCPSALGVF